MTIFEVVGLIAIGWGIIAIIVVAALVIALWRGME